MAKPRNLAPLRSLSAAAGQCKSQAQAYGQCMLANYQNIERDACATEFAAFQRCVQTTVRGEANADEAACVVDTRKGERFDQGQRVAGTVYMCWSFCESFGFTCIHMSHGARTWDGDCARTLACSTRSLRHTRNPLHHSIVYLYTCRIPAFYATPVSRSSASHTDW